MHAVTKKRTRVGSKTQTRGRAVAAATATYDSSTAADQAAAADSFDQSNPSPWADQAKAAADAASAQAVSQAAAQQTASDTAADDGKVSEIAANDAEAALADNQSQAWHDQVLAMAQGENAFSLASAGSAAQLAAADAYFAAVGGAGVGAGSPDPATTGVPAPLSGPGGDTPITLTGDYGSSHPIGSYWVGDTADSIDAVVSNMFRRGPDPEAAIGPQGSWAYTWFGAGEGMPYGPIATSVQPGLNMMSPGLQSAQPNVATPNVFGPQILAQTGASGGAATPPPQDASASAGAPTDTGNPAHAVPLNGNLLRGNTHRGLGGDATTPSSGASLLGTLANIIEFGGAAAVVAVMGNKAPLPHQNHQFPQEFAKEFEKTVKGLDVHDFTVRDVDRRVVHGQAGAELKKALGEAGATASNAGKWNSEWKLFLEQLKQDKTLTSEQRAEKVLSKMLELSKKFNIDITKMNGFNRVFNAANNSEAIGKFLELTSKYGVDSKYAGQIKSLWKTLNSTAVGKSLAKTLLSGAKIGGKIAPWVNIVLIGVAIEQHGVKGAMSDELGISTEELDSLLEANVALNPWLTQSSVDSVTLPAGKALGWQQVLAVGGYADITNNGQYVGQAKITAIYQTGTPGVYTVVLDSTSGRGRVITIDMNNLQPFEMTDDVIRYNRQPIITVPDVQLEDLGPFSSEEGE